MGVYVHLPPRKQFPSLPLQEKEIWIDAADVYHE